MLLQFNRHYYNFIVNHFKKQTYLIYKNNKNIYFAIEDILDTNDMSKIDKTQSYVYIKL